jgi:protein pelota
MKKLHTNLKKGEIKLEIENLDDLWYLSQIIDSGDLVSGKTFRKIKIGGASSDEKSKVTRKPVFLEVKVENIEYSREGSMLRVTGKITKGPDDVGLGLYHTFNLEEKSKFMVVKDKWLDFQLEKINEAVKNKESSILLMLFDREEAYYAILKKYGYEVLAGVKGNVNKKDFEQAGTKNFYKQIVEDLKNYDERFKLTKIIAGCPAFYKDELKKFLINNAELSKKVLFASCSYVGNKGFNELLNRNEVKTALHEERVAEEFGLVEDLLNAIAKESASAYGLKEVELASQAGAVEVLLVTDALIGKLREEKRFEVLDKIFRLVSEAKAKVKIISHEHEGGKKLDGLGGIGAILRFRIG